MTVDPRRHASRAQGPGGRHRGVRRTHLLLLVGFVGGYSIVVLAIAALGAHVSRMAQRVLLAIEHTA